MSPRLLCPSGGEYLSAFAGRRGSASAHRDYGAAGPLAPVERRVGLAHLVERVAARDELADADLAPRDELDQLGQVGGNAGAVGALDRHAAADEASDLDVGGRGARRQADDDDAAAVGDGVEGGEDGVGAAERLEGDVDTPAAGQLAHLGGGVVAGGVDGERRAQLLRRLELLVADVDGDDVGGAEDAGDLDDVAADAADADHGDGLADRHLALVADGAVGGGHGAAEDASLLQPEIVRDGKDGGRRHDGILGEAAGAVHGEGRAVAAEEARLAVEEGALAAVEGEERLAEVVAAAHAELAAAAGQGERDDDAVAAPDPGAVWGGPG